MSYFRSSFALKNDVKQPERSKIKEVYRKYLTELNEVSAHHRRHHYMFLSHAVQQ